MKKIIILLLCTAITNNIDCIDQLNNMQTSCSIGNGCDGAFRVIELPHDIQLNDEYLEVLNVEIRVNGVVRYYEEIINVDLIQEGVYENLRYLCDNSKIVLIE